VRSLKLCLLLLQAAHGSNESRAAAATIRRQTMQKGCNASLAAACAAWSWLRPPSPHPPHPHPRAYTCTGRHETQRSKPPGAPGNVALRR
jgi:hypothetical protein